MRRSSSCASRCVSRTIAYPATPNLSGGRLCFARRSRKSAIFSPTRSGGSPCIRYASHFSAINSFAAGDRKSTRLNSRHSQKSYAVFFFKKKKKKKSSLCQIRKDCTPRHQRSDVHKADVL